MSTDHSKTEETAEVPAAEKPEPDISPPSPESQSQSQETKRDKTPPAKIKKPRYDIEKLKLLTVKIERQVPKPRTTIERAIKDFALITPVRRPDEGKNPLCHKPEFRSRSSSSSSSSSDERSRSRGRSDSSSDEDRRRHRRRRRYSSRSRSPRSRYRHSRYDDRHRHSRSPYQRRDRHDRPDRRRGSQEQLVIVKHEDVDGNPIGPYEVEEETEEVEMRHPGYNGRGRGMRGGMYRHPMYPIFPPPMYPVFPPFPPPHRPPRYPKPRY